MAKKRNALSTSKRRGAREAAQRRIPLWTWFAVGAVAAVVLVAGLLYLGNQGPEAIASSDIPGLVILPDPGRGHADGDIHYEDETPAGGTHNPQWQNCGIYDEPVREENVVHSLEHGAVWIAYEPDLAAEQVEGLRELVRAQRQARGEPMIVLAPKDELDSPIMATAWRAKLALEDASDERLVQFVERFQRGPFTPEPGASCWDSVGEPL